MGLASPNLSRRLASASGALLLQGAFLLLLLYSTPSVVPATNLEHELTLILPRLQKAPPLVIDAAPREAPARAPNPGVSAPITLPPASLTPIIPPSAIQGFGEALYNCAPQNYAALPEDQKAQCSRPGAGVAIQEAPNLIGTPSHVKNEARWQAELAHKQSPLRVPCAKTLHNRPGTNDSFTTGVVLDTMEFDLACLAMGFAAGTVDDPTTWPTYATKQLQPEDFYKIEQTYNEWHKDHAKTP